MNDYMPTVTHFAATEPSGDLMSTLGIDWMTLIFQIIAFLVLLFLLGKFVYPWLMKSVDERQADIEAAGEAAAAAEKKAAEAQAEVRQLLKEARAQASDIVATAKEEATAAVESAEQKAKSKSEAIVSAAHEQIEKDIRAAQKTLHNETIELVALATEKVVGKTVSAKVDETLIASAVKETK